MFLIGIRGFFMYHDRTGGCLEFFIIGLEGIYYFHDRTEEF